MEKEKIRLENEKQAYEKPALTKHGVLKDVTADGTVRKTTGPILGCTRL